MFQNNADARVAARRGDGGGVIVGACGSGSRASDSNSTELSDFAVWARYFRRYFFRDPRNRRDRHVPDDSRMLASAPAFSQGSSPKCCVAVQTFRTSPRMKWLDFWQWTKKGTLWCFWNRKGRTLFLLRGVALHLGWVPRKHVPVPQSHAQSVWAVCPTIFFHRLDYPAENESL